MPRVLMVIAPVMFRDEEYAQPKEILTARGAKVVTASRRPGRCTGKLGMIATAELAVADASATDYDAVVFVGGGGSEIFFDDAEAHRLARETLEAGRTLAAICIAPSTLAHAGLLDGRRATAFPTQEEDLTAHGALWSSEPVTIDGDIITANGPGAASAFGEAIASALGL
jgi:protease I